jgi:6-phosphogluconolactonase
MAPGLQSGLQQHHASSAAGLAQDLAAHLSQQLREAIRSKGQAMLAVSGGKSPIALFEALRSQALDWAKVTVILVDERCVAPEHADSNTDLVRKHLLQDLAAAAEFIPFFDTLTEPLDDAALDALVDSANRRLAKLPWPIDVAVLGMGEDGHTASLFPAAPGLDQALRSSGPLAWVRPVNTSHARLTLTLPALLACRELVIAISGQAKQAIYHEALKMLDPALPVSLVLHQQQTPVTVWLS